MSGLMFGETFIPTSSSQNLIILGERKSISFYCSPANYIESLKTLLRIIIDDYNCSEITRVATTLEQASKFYNDVFCYCVEQCKSDPDNTSMNLLFLLEEFSTCANFPEISSDD